MLMNPFLLLSLFLSFSFILLLYFYMMQKKTIRKLEENLLILSDDNNDANERNKNLELQYAVLQARYEEEKNSAKERIVALEEAKESLSQEFKLLANRIFEEKSQKFSSANKEQLEYLLKPFREQISNFSKEAKEQFFTYSKETYLLKDELKRLKEMNAQLSQDAINLTKALKGENKTQGNWGELVLENILEASGLRKGVEYELQETLLSRDGKSYRPDVIIHMPEQRDIIIDSKVSLVAYERFMSSEDEKLKKEALKAHIKSIEKHIDDLSSKEYEKLEGVNSLDFVLLFMPIEGAFLLALEADSRFFTDAYNKNILVVSPSTLLVTLRTIEHIWRTQRQEEHALKIAHEAEAMYEKLVGFVDELKKVGGHLQKAQDAYDTSMNRLSTGRGNVIGRAEKIVKLGIKPKKSLSIKSQEDAF